MTAKWYAPSYYTWDNRNYIPPPASTTRPTSKFALMSRYRQVPLYHFSLDSHRCWKKLLYLNFASTISAEASVALALCYLLNKSRTGFAEWLLFATPCYPLPLITCCRTDGVINILMVYAIHTGSSRRVIYISPSKLVFIRRMIGLLTTSVTCWYRFIDHLNVSCVESWLPSRLPPT